MPGKLGDKEAHKIIPEGTEVIQKTVLPNGNPSEKIWRIGKLLGKGGFGCCYEFHSAG